MSADDSTAEKTPRVELEAALRAIGGGFHSAGDLLEGAAEGYRVLRDKVTTPWTTLRDSFTTLRDFTAQLKPKPKRDKGAGGPEDPNPDSANEEPSAAELAAAEREAFRQAERERAAREQFDDEDQV